MGDWVVWAGIAVGSGAGGLLRHAVTEGLTRVAGSGFPLATLVVNVVGSAAIGAIVAVAGAGSWSPLGRHAVMTGVLGGFTTFSTFSVQTMALIQQGRWVAGLANAVLSVCLGLTACWAGYEASRLAIR